MPQINSQNFDTFQESIKPQNRIHLEKCESIGKTSVNYLVKKSVSNIKDNFKQNIGWSTHSKFFNDIFNGIAPVTAIAAQPGNGKTRLARSLAIDFLNADPYNVVLYLSGEEDSSEITENVLSRLLCVNTSLWGEKLSIEGQLPVYISKKIHELIRTRDKEKKNLFTEYMQILNRFKFKSKGDDVFSSRESFKKAIAEAITNSIIGDKPLNELLVVVDHLGEFDLGGGNTEGDYERTNGVLNLIKEATAQKEGEYVLDFKTMINNKEMRSELLEETYNTVFDKLQDIMDSNSIRDENGNDYTKESLKKQIYYTKIKFLVLCQLKSEANQEFGGKVIKQWKWTDGSIGGSKKIGERMQQIIYLWNLKGFNESDAAITSQNERTKRVMGDINMGMIKIAKNRRGLSNKIFPYQFNTGSQEISIPPCRNLINSGTYEKWIEDNSFDDKNELSKSRAMTNYLNMIRNDTTMTRWLSSWEENKIHQKRFNKLFEIDALINQLNIKE